MSNQHCDKPAADKWHQRRLIDVTSTWIQNIHPCNLGTYIPVVDEGRSKAQSFVFLSDYDAPIDKYAYEEDVNNLNAVIASALDSTEPSASMEACSTVLCSIKDSHSSRRIVSSTCKHVDKTDWKSSAPARVRNVAEPRDANQKGRPCRTAPKSSRTVRSRVYSTHY